MGLKQMMRRIGLLKSDAPVTTMDKMSAALHTSVVSIVKEGTPDERAALLDETLAQYREAVLDSVAHETVFAKAGKPAFLQDDDDADDDEKDEDEDDLDDEGDGDPDDEEDGDMSEALRKRVQELEDQLKVQSVQKAAFDSLQGEVVTLRKAESDRVNLAKASDLLGEGASDEEIRQTADMIEKGIDTTFVSKLAKQRAAFAKAAALTIEVGSTIAKDGTSPNARIAKAAEDILKAEPHLTNEQAIAKALTSDPSLYAAAL